MVKNKVKKSAGYTFIEVIIAVGIITILSGISLASYGKFSQRKKLDNTVSEFKQTFEVAKKKTLSTDKTSLITGGVDYSTCSLASYKVIISSATSYSLVANVCDNTASCPLSSGCLDITLATYSTSYPVTASPTSGSIIFDPTTKTASGVSSIVFTHPTLNQSHTLTIDKSGLIY